MVGRSGLEGVDREAIPGPKALLFVALDLAMMLLVGWRRRGGLDIENLLLGFVNTHCRRDGDAGGGREDGRDRERKDGQLGARFNRDAGKAWTRLQFTAEGES